MDKKPLTIKEFASMGGKACAKNRTKAERTAAAKKAANARWKKARAVALVLAVLALPSTARADSIFDVAPYTVALAGNVADARSSLRAFSRGAEEGNPFLSQQPAVFLATKAAGTVGILYGMHWLSAHDHRTAARVVGYLDGSIMLVIARHNAGVAR